MVTISILIKQKRRFGKSLFLDTLKNIFLGKKELFKGLYIYDKYDFSKAYPVINISFAKAKFRNTDDLLDKNKNSRKI